MSLEDINKIKRKKWDCITTKHVHQMRLSSLRQRNTLVDTLALVVPIVYVPMRYLVKGTAWGTITEHAWEMLSAVLLAFAATKLSYRWQERAEKHAQLISENISLTTQADYFLSKSDKPTSGGKARKG
jgi:mobilome CxxCx(11)CxxC protein